MYTVILTEAFRRWLSSLADRRAIVRIAARLRRAESGNLGDWKPVGDGLFEMREPYGPGYRIYFVRQGPVVIVLLAGGDKSTQTTDIARALVMARQLKENQ